MTIINIDMHLYLFQSPKLFLFEWYMVYLISTHHLGLVSLFSKHNTGRVRKISETDFNGKVTYVQNSLDDFEKDLM